MARVLGLDLGSYAVRAVMLETSLRTSHPKGYWEFPLGSPGPDESTDRFAGLRGALAGLAAQNLHAEQVVVALPGASVATHLLSLPFGDPKRIEATVPFEVESQLPYDLAEAVFDYQVSGQTDKGTDLWVGVGRKEELAALLAFLAEHKVDPRVVTHSGLVYQNFFHGAVPLVAASPDVPVAILDLGKTRTSLAIGRAGVGVEFARTFAGAGDELTRAISSDFQVSLEEAERWKVEHGALGDAAIGPDAERAAGAMVRAFQPIFRELRASLKAFVARSRVPVGKVLLCGGTSRLPGLAGQLTRDLGVATEPLTLGDELAGVIPSTEHPVAAQALALAMRTQASGPRAPRFNLRRGEFAFKGDYDYVREKLGRLAAFAAVLLILLIGSGIVRNAVLARRERAVDAALCEITQRVLGKCEKSYDKALSMLQGKESPSAVIPKSSAVGLLADFIQRLPQDVPLTVDRIVVQADRLEVRCQTDSPKEIDKITAALRTNRCFKEVRGGKVEKTRDGQKVEFRLDVQVECPEAAAPPQG